MDEEIFIELCLTEKQTRVVKIVLKEWLEENEKRALSATNLRITEVYEALKTVTE